ncbi:hypothetical protein HMPREF0202_00760 [Cetobacterium somerae ATCC BAA-474]|uniref:Uncharacterized protein n=1 Tax=Cetobacterium somerae ATCC BAA-474 TaxID=1319815 RepID=U7VCP4_9FUSO|nr:hypothetical protein [Cetobacterium somerae]ERT69251.1 hypothetical protein HMPREF0202_00760 [Cetobacterium somerae ATCC BAA-474]
MYNVTRDMLIEILEGYIKLAKKLDGELVVLNKVDDEADEFLIENIKDFNLIKTKKNDLLEITIYVDDEDEVYEEFVIGDGSDYSKVQKNIYEKFPKYFKVGSLGNKSDSKKSGKIKENQVNKDSQNNYFQKFMKKK